MNTILRLLDKPLTPLMIQTLMDCHERELMDLEPYDALVTRSIASLVRRGMMATRLYTSKEGKTFLAAYITKTGKAYLTNLCNQS